jgi:phytoene synthase
MTTKLDDPADAAARAAAGSSFYAGMRVLPRAERTAMFAVYAFCRAVDDIADDEGIEESRRRSDLDRWRGDLEALYAGRPAGDAAFLKIHVDRFGLQKEDFLAVVDGMQMDVDDVIVAPEHGILDLYCDRVASAVGRLSVRIFGMDDAHGAPLAHHLGRALQITNILRDLDEDAAIGRLYMAKDWLLAAGAPLGPPMDVLAHPNFDGAARRAAAEARAHYAAADAVLSRRPRGRLIAPRLMSGVYGAILERMETKGWSAPRRRVSLSKPALALIVLRRGLFRQ